MYIMISLESEAYRGFVHQYQVLLPDASWNSILFIMPFFQPSNRQELWQAFLLPDMIKNSVLRTYCSPTARKPEEPE